jgi:protein-disulfide isomerase
MASLTTRSRVEKDIERGKALKVMSTPSFFVNGKPLNFEDTEFQRFRAVIESELQKSRGN